MKLSKPVEIMSVCLPDELTKHNFYQEEFKTAHSKESENPPLHKNYSTENFRRGRRIHNYQNPSHNNEPGKY